MEGLIRTCRAPYMEIAKAGEVIAILADHGTDPRIPQAFATAAMSLGLEPIVAVMPISEHDYHDPPRADSGLRRGCGRGALHDVEIPRAQPLGS